MVISKLNFSKLFAEAWLRAVTPANIIAGFRKCGIHPFNRNAIPILEEVQHNDMDAEDELKHDGMDDEPRDNEVEEQQFTYDQISLFQRRYEEGIDVFEDQDYVTWLHLNHPEAVPSDHSSLRSPTSVLDEFSDISPLDEIQLSVMESSTSTSALTLPTVSSVMESSTSTSALTPPTISSVMEPSTSASALTPPTVSSSTSTSALTPSTVSSSTSTSALTPPTVSSSTSTSVLTPPTVSSSTSTSALTPPTVSSITDPSTSTSPAGTSAMDFSSASGITTPLSSKQGDTQAKMKKVSPVAKYLQMPTISKTKTPPALSKNCAVTGARVLTSAQCLQIIKEKEMKKQLEEEEKEKRRKEREAKKKQREEEKQRKAEERERKAEERAQIAKEKEDAKARKAEEKARKQVERAGAKRTRKTPPGSDCSDQSPPAIAQQKEQNTSACESSTRSAAKRLRLDDSILTDKCCVCLQSFEDDIEAGAGVDWIQCACSRWLHEDCIIECITDKDGKDRFCPFCT